MESVRRIDNDKFLLKLGRLSQARDIIYHLRLSETGLSVSELYNISKKEKFGFTVDTLKQLMQDGWIEEYMGKYLLSDIALEILKYGDQGYDIIPSVNERIRKIEELLNQYKIRQESASYDGDAIEQDKNAICKKLRDLKRNVHTEISALKTQMESDYCNEKNWTVKKTQLDNYHKKLLEMQEMIWLNRDIIKGDKLEHKQCLLTMLAEDNNFTKDNGIFVMTYIDNMKILISTELTSLINIVNAHIACVVLQIDDTNHINTVFNMVAIAPNKETMNVLYGLSGRYNFPPENRRKVLPAVSPRSNIISLEKIRDAFTPEMGAALSCIDIETGLPTSTQNIPRTFGGKQKTKSVIKLNGELLLKQFLAQDKELGEYLKNTFPEAEKPELVSLFMKTIREICETNGIRIMNRDMTHFVDNIKCIQIRPENIHLPTKATPK